MANENLLVDENSKPVIGAVTDDSNQYIKMGRIDDATKGLKVMIVGGTGVGTVTSVSVTSGNGFAGTVATATSTPAITLSTTITGLLQGNGTAISAVTIGSGLSLVAGTLSATGGGGTVTSVSVVSANGFTGTVATATTTPAITLTTSITGMIRGTGTALSAAGTGTDNHIVRYDSTNNIQDSAVTIADTTGMITVPASSGITSLGELDLLAGGDGLPVTITASNGTTNSSNGGNVDITAGDSSTSGGNAIGGGLNFNAGSGFGSSAGGIAGIYAGTGGDTGAGGRAELFGGNGGATSGTGGNAVVSGGNGSAGNANGGDVILSGGLKNGVGTDGKIILHQNTTSSIGAILSISSIASTDKTFTFLNTTGNIPSVTGTDRKTAQTGAVSLATYTVGASDASFLVSANILVTTATLHNFTCTCTYTDESNTSRTLTLNFSTLAGVLTPTVVNTNGAIAYEGVPLHIRAKASTTIIIATTGTFTTVAYNFEEMITQIA